MFEYDNYKASIRCMGVVNWGATNAHKYICTVKNPANGASVYMTYHKGLGHNGKRPTVKELIDALVLDARAYLTTETIENFIAEFGGTMQQFNACAKSVEKCARLGIDPNNSAFDEI